MPIPIITKKEANSLMLRHEGKVSISLDLGLTETEVLIEDGMVHIRNEKIPLSYFEKVKDKTCYLVENGALYTIQLFSEESNFYYKLVPTSDWPTITLSSTPMHRHTHMSPKVDTERKIVEVAPVAGRVLDTCCGLGYTAIMAAKEASEVVTFERDKYVLKMCELNPHSQELFTNKKITVINKDVFEGIARLKTGHFHRIIHDPPTLKYSPMLYSNEFYSQLFRVLASGGIMYHYAPSPKKTHGELLYPTLIKRLEKIGFTDMEFHEASSGIVCHKP